MESDLNDAVFPEEDLDDDDDDETPEDEEDYDDETEPPPFVLAVVAVAPPASTASETLDTTLIPISAVADSSLKPLHPELIEEKKALDDSRRLFQRLWTDEDEIGLLQGFLDYTAQRGSSHHSDTALFYDQIKSKLQLGFNKNQLVEKLRRLKKKYRNVVTKISSGKDVSFKSPHDKATFEISRRIWSNTAPISGPVEDDDEINPNPNFGNSAKTPISRKRSRPQKRELNDGSTLNRDNNCIGNNNNNSNSNNNNNNENCNGRHNLQGLIEETVKSCVSPVLKELVCGTGGMGLGRGFGVGGGLALNSLQTQMTMPMTLLNLRIGETTMDEKWRKQQILELEVYSKRLELVQNEIKVALEELRSAGGV
ncbi:probable transcription factor At3g04930 [Glycine soja]|uniref:Putative transcription factor isoform A n=1 Tax=Glycine soja TaxID=3848 RepID=A0A445IN57_GLYSO|nr:probable transcription factor At3g04930 [Glycine soja]XP_028185354.1 probable transcription factor At3g04930 [Glycine soja]RZB87506.1 putative transcription factor isoform A [Glycine soja]RZB87507.1 putative transcription factor isoform B [Glycine soja]RZB87508.1 putative transcription factor isoform C [Glycine soja]